MSLLSGIKFVKREERISVNDSRSKKKHKHTKDDKKRKYKRHKSNDKDDVITGKYSEDAFKITKDEYEELNQHRISEITSESEDEYIISQKHETSDIVPYSSNDKFSSMLSLLVNEKAPDNLISNSELIMNHNDPTNQKYDNSIAEEQSLPTSPNLKSNLSVAAKLRAQLQSKKSLLLTTSNNQNTIVYGDTQNIALHIVQQNNPSNNTIMQQNTKILKDLKNKDNTNEIDDNNNNLTLKEMIAIERTGGENMDKNFCQNMLKLGDNFKGMDEEDEDDIDMSLFENKSYKLSVEKRIAREKSLAQNEMKTQSTIIQTCQYCMEGNAYKAMHHLTISMSSHCILRLKPVKYALHPLHSELFPMNHNKSILACEEEVRLDVDRYKGCLKAMFSQLGFSLLFSEVAININSKRPSHAVIDVIPVMAGYEEEAKMFFKEALSSCDEQWSTHKRLLPLTEVKPLYKTIPSQFPYVTIEWNTCIASSSSSSSKGTSNNSTNSNIGLAHVVEDDSKFTQDFCLDVIAGMLDKDSMRIRRKSNHSSSQNNDSEKRRVEDFKKHWEMFDWTQYLSME